MPGTKSVNKPNKLSNSAFAEVLMPAPKGRRFLTQSEMIPLPRARLVGEADANENVQVTVSIRRKPGAPALPGHEYWMRTPPGRRRFLSPEEFAALYGAAEIDIDTVTNFAHESGLKVIEAHAGRRSAILSGSVAQMNNAFGIRLSNYEVPGLVRPSKFSGKSGPAPAQTYRGHAGAIHLPNAVADVVEAVVGLDNRRTGGRNAHGDDPPNISPLTVPQVVSKYNFPTSKAAGQSIGIVSMGGGYDAGDITTYFSSFVGTLVAPTIVTRSVNSGVNEGNDFETLQDILISSSVAQGATIVVYFVATSGLGDAQAWLNLLNRLIVPDAGETAPAVMTSSYFVAQSDDGTAVSTSNLTLISSKFQELAFRGITFFAAAGDSGSDSGVGDTKVHVQYPGSDPWVTSCGGTALGSDAQGNLDETVWNDWWGTFREKIFGATGGGVSDFFALPRWQASAGVPASFNDGKVRRGVPDVAGNASPNSGYPMSGGGQAFVGDGTSAVAPLYAGLAAVINAALGQPIGFLNPTLYALGEKVFRDITSGNNLWGSPANAAKHFYSAGPGWDACTGWGVVNGNAILNALAHSTSMSYSGSIVDIGVGSGDPAVVFINVDATPPGFVAGWIHEPQSPQGMMLLNACQAAWELCLAQSNYRAQFVIDSPSGQITEVIV
jgi:kumamolisin